MGRNTTILKLRTPPPVFLVEDWSHKAKGSEVLPIPLIPNLKGLAKNVFELLHMKCQNMNK